ncbi:MAG TPA: zinc-dependent metalloprotease [Gemmatimonadaceae bacterium]|nr:zinc-dependent metalloprotease [Gemmatimonadaceae bacterium]
MHRTPRLSLVATLLAIAVTFRTAVAQVTPPPPTQPPLQQPPEGAAQGAAARRAPRPYAQVVPPRAHTERGGITNHHVDDRWLLEVPDSLMGRDFLLVSRIAGVPAGTGGFQSAGSSLAERVVRWERVTDRVLLRSISVDAVADDSLPISRSVRQNNFAPILASFPIQAFAKDSNAYVVDVTDFFGGDTPALSGLSAAQRRTYQVRRFDQARSYVSTVRSFPINLELRHVQTFDAAEPPGDRSAGTVSLEMRQSMVLLPKVPMRVRHHDPRVGFFTVDRVNYGLDEQKAATQTFIARWRLEPGDPAAYARGEIVEPVKPITYFMDPATPTKWRRYVKEGVEAWQKVFEKAGFKRAIIARDAPTPAEDPDWDPDDARVSMVRWAASLVRNAVGPHTSDPRTGEILNSEITWYHNHMRSYRNRLMIETGAANPGARTLDIPEELMGETMRQVITHEIGHALGLQHNMVASNSFPVDSLRSPAFTRVYGVSATIMDYARQNYVAQPGDGLQPRDFIRRLGPFDDFVINWGYRAIPAAKSAEEERPILHKWITDQKGPMPYRFVPQGLGSLDPRAQTEDVGDDAVKASGYAIANLKRVVPNLVAWTSRAGEDYDDLNEVYGETLQMWSLYMGHVATWIGGVNVDLKSADQAGAVYRVVPQAKQKGALAFLSENVFVTPQWLQPQEVVSRIGPPALATRQAAVLTSLMSAARLARLTDLERFDAANAWPLAEYLSDIKRAVWGAPGTGAAPDANRRTLQRVYVERLGAIIHPPAPPTPIPGGGAAAPTPAPPPFLTPPNVERSDLPALARAQLREIQREARAAAIAAQGAVARAHWADIADRVDAVLEVKK